MVVRVCGVSDYVPKHDNHHKPLLEVKRTNNQVYNKSFNDILQVEMEKLNDLQNNSSRAARFT